MISFLWSRTHFQLQTIGDSDNLYATTALMDKSCPAGKLQSTLNFLSEAEAT
ncbi:hypothetical protein LEMLEM_LOCUS26539, partial [Lemmus lemmus]